MHEGRLPEKRVSAGKYDHKVPLGSSALEPDKENKSTKLFLHSLKYTPVALGDSPLALLRINMAVKEGTNAIHTYGGHRI